MRTVLFYFIISFLLARARAPFGTRKFSKKKAISIWIETDELEKSTNHSNNESPFNKKKTFYFEASHFCYYAFEYHTNPISWVDDPYPGDYRKFSHVSSILNRIGNDFIDVFFFLIWGFGRLKKNGNEILLSGEREKKSAVFESYWKERHNIGRWKRNKRIENLRGAIGTIVSKVAVTTLAKNAVS